MYTTNVLVFHMNGFARYLLPLAFGLLGFFSFFPRAHADHEGPERVIDGKYVVILSLFPEEEGMKLRFSIRDMMTGKAVTVPVTGTVSLQEAESETKIGEERFTTENGRGEVVHVFPRDGLYEIALSFETSDTPGKIYESVSWQLWMPGVESGGVPLPGLSEWLGFSLLGCALLVLLINILQRRKRKGILRPL